MSVFGHLLHRGKVLRDGVGKGLRLLCAGFSNFVVIMKHNCCLHVCLLHML